MSSRGHMQNFFKAAAKKAVLLPLTAAFIAGCSTTGGVVQETQAEELHDVVKAIGANSYEQGLFEFNGKSLTKPRTDMTPQEKMGFYVETFCFKPGSSGVWNAHFKENWKAYPAFSDLTLFGKPLSERALDLDVSYCDLPTLPAGFGGQYLPTIGAVILPKNLDDLRQPLVLAHEVMHAAQDSHGALATFYEWDVESRIHRTIAVEAAAFTVEFMVAFEAKLRGEPKLWDHLKNDYHGGVYADAGMYTLIEQKYTDASKSGMAHEAALKSAAFHAFHRVFDNAEWRNFYLDFTLKAYIDDIGEGRLKNVRAIKAKEYTQKRLDRAGLIGTETSFTQGATLPPAEKLLAANPKMKWAFEVADIERYSQLLGKDDAVVLELSNKAIEGKNPYLGLDINEVHARMAARALLPASVSPFKLVYEVMDAMLLEQSPPRLKALPRVS